MVVDLRRISDIETLMRWREEVILSVFGLPAGRGLPEANREYYVRHIADDSHFAIIASVDGEDCGCGAICLSEELPSPDNPSGRCAYLMNIYVREQHRAHGVAHAIVKRLIDEARGRGCGKIYLETTDDGRPVYESLNFRNMENMMKYSDFASEI